MSHRRTLRTSIDMVDLTDSSQRNMAGYVPTTLKPNSPRYSILPAYPTSIYENKPPPLLLANVSGKFIIK